MNKMNMEKERWEVQGSLNIQEEKIEITLWQVACCMFIDSDIPHQSTQSRKRKKRHPFIPSCNFEEIREGVLALEQEVLHWNSVHEVAFTMFKEELVTADKIP